MRRCGGLENKIVLTITEISEYIKNLMESDPMLGQVWLKGEISNFKRHSSGHLYLTLKDGGGVLRAVMFRGAAGNLLFEPKDGMKVMVRCKISVYPASGNYQAYISEMEQDGVGDLHAAFEALKQKLHAEGCLHRSIKNQFRGFLPRRNCNIANPARHCRI